MNALQGCAYENDNQVVELHAYRHEDKANPAGGSDDKGMPVSYDAAKVRQAQAARQAAGLPLFDGATFDPAEDAERLGHQLAAVQALMRDGQWHTLAELAQASGGSEAGCSARLRDLRKARWGGHTVARRRRSGGLWEYRLQP